jgi:hypothetical protein
MFAGQAKGRVCCIAHGPQSDVLIRKTKESQSNGYPETSLTNGGTENGENDGLQKRNGFSMAKQ